jgi:hypothetical protein
MSWVQRWGLPAIVNAGFSVRDQLREAIQRLSPAARQRHIFTHTGWHELQGKWLYLTANGALGRDDVEVELGPALSRYRLPHTVRDPVSAMRASLQLLDLAPLEVTVPLFAGIYRAPLATAYPLDLSLWLEGITGSLKSTLVALFLCHFGKFDRTHLPGAWISTANQLERRAFILKDIPFVIDDYAPSALEVRELEIKAARLLRAQGNLQGRGRLRADLTEQPDHPPRGLIISTGEQHPTGQSILARTVIVQVRRSDIDLPVLSEAQEGAGRLSEAMSGYISWLAPQMPGLPALLERTFQGTRLRAASGYGHLRVPETLAHLWIGVHCGLTYAQEISACSQTEADELADRCWKALCSLGRAQSRLVEGERPSRRFLGVLHTLVTQGRALLLPKDQPAGALSREFHLTIWFDDDSIYLSPEAAFQAVARFCRDTGEGFPVRQVRLMGDLKQEGISECDPGRRTTTTKIGGHAHRVLKLNRQMVENLLGSELPTSVTTVTDVTGS